MSQFQVTTQDLMLHLTVVLLWLFLLATVYQAFLVFDDPDSFGVC